MNLVGTIFLLRSDVYVLVYPIEQPQQELLCVVLHIATILHAVPRHRGSKVAGNFRRHAASPQRLHDGAEALRELSASSRLRLLPRLTERRMSAWYRLVTRYCAKGSVFARH